MRTRVAFLVLLVLCSAPRRAAAIPVFDTSNFAQNLVTAIEAVDQTLTMIEQLQHDIAHHETVVDDLIRNGAAPAVYTWDKLNSIKDRLRRIANGLRLQNLDLKAWLEQFRNLDYYRSAPCYGPDLSCPEREWERILAESWQMHELASHTRKQTLDDLMTALDQGEKDLQQQAENLEDLQRQAQDAKGEMQALQAGNQLASAEVMQLMQMRAIMYAQYWALAAQAQHEQALQAQQRAASARYRSMNVQDSGAARWQALPARPGL